MYQVMRGVYDCVDFCHLSRRSARRLRKAQFALHRYYPQDLRAAGPTRACKLDQHPSQMENRALGMPNRSSGGTRNLTRGAIRAPQVSPPEIREFNAIGDVPALWQTLWAIDPLCIEYPRAAGHRDIAHLPPDFAWLINASKQWRVLHEPEGSPRDDHPSTGNQDRGQLSCRL